MTLHICKDKAALETLFNTHVQVLSENDAILLIEAAVYEASQVLAAKAQAFVLKEDLLARGLENKCSKNFSQVSFPEFVALTEQHEKIISW